MDEELEELASKLYSIFTGKHGDWKSEIPDYKNEWYKQAKHVQRLLINARISESSRLDNYEQTTVRLKYLMKQLTEIGGWNG